MEEKITFYKINMTELSLKFNNNNNNNDFPALCVRNKFVDRCS